MNRNHLLGIGLVFATALGWVPPPARGQCNPQQMAKIIASDAASSDGFGVSVSISGDTMVVGAWQDDTAGGMNAGSVYVFVRTGNSWIQQAKLTASDAAAEDNFGVSVSLSGETLVVGSWGDDNAGGVDAGAAYVFIRSGTTWTEQGKLVAADGASGDFLGVRVAVAGDTAVAGAYLHDHAGWSDTGAAYVFVRNGAVWTQQQRLTANDSDPFDQFGHTVAISDETVVVGAYNDDSSPEVDTGAAYVFTRVGGLWIQQAKLVPMDVAGDDEFGVSVSVSGDTLVAGSWLDDYAGGVDAGSAYVYVRSGGLWTQQTKLTASDAAAFDRFGRAVSISGDAIVVGAPEEDNDGGNMAGCAYAFVRAGGAWAEKSKLVVSDAAPNDQLGNFSITVSGQFVGAGAWLDDHAGGTDAGSAYVFDLSLPQLGDLDDDGDVDLVDGMILADVLVGIDLIPQHVARADLNCSGTRDGLDIMPFVDVLLN